MVGHETTASVINFTLLRLAQHPAHQTRLREEVLSRGGNLRYEDLNGGKMPWLDAVVKEG
jgi:cytochrome P450